MAKSFSRWGHITETTWVFQVFDKYNTEMEQNLAAHLLASGYIYKELGKTASWVDKISKYFPRVNANGKYNSLKEWSVGYDEFENWTYLNMIMSISSNFETYLATVVDLALSSDPGVLLGNSHTIDGISLIKKSKPVCVDYNGYVVNITKGTWHSRINAFERVFGSVPSELIKNVTLLEDVRKLRNNVGRAFGRDIESTRNHVVKNVLPVAKITKTKMRKIKDTVRMIAKDIDG